MANRYMKFSEWPAGILGTQKSCPHDEATKPSVRTFAQWHEDWLNSFEQECAESLVFVIANSIISRLQYLSAYFVQPNWAKASGGSLITTRFRAVHTNLPKLSSNQKPDAGSLAPGSGIPESFTRGLYAHSPQNRLSCIVGLSHPFAEPASKHVVLGRRNLGY